MRRVKKAIERRREALARLEITCKVKEDLKTVALGTSKINYLDPRITVAWCKMNEARIAPLAICTSCSALACLALVAQRSACMHVLQ